MGKQIFFAIISIISIIKEASSTNVAQEVTKLCRKRTSILGGEELVCQNATVSFFSRFDLVLNKTHWFTCENCSLEILDDRSFNVPKNNVNFLYLVQCGIHSIRPFTFGNFLGLRVLNLRNNFIENVSLGGFANLTKLYRLDLSYNKLRILSNNLFLDLKNLDLLNLNHNCIYHIQLEAFAGLSLLKYLYLNDNCLEKLDGFIFKHLTYLMLLYLENNRIVQIDSFAFSNLTRLAALYLNNNSVSYLVPYNFKPLSGLTDLQLRGNNLTEIQTSSFNGLRSLRFLSLGRNRLRNVKPYGFVGLPSLESLELIDNEFEILDLEYFRGVENLSVLWLEHNRISNFTIDYKSDPFESLQSLGLSNNNLTSFNYKLLYNKMPAIKDIFIHNNLWKCEFLVNMFNYLHNKSVNLCVGFNCDANKTKDYIEDVCSRAAEEKEREHMMETSTEIRTVNTATCTFSMPFLKLTVLVVIFGCR